MVPETLIKTSWSMRWLHLVSTLYFYVPSLLSSFGLRLSSEHHVLRYSDAQVWSLAVGNHTLWWFHSALCCFAGVIFSINRSYNWNLNDFAFYRHLLLLFVIKIRTVMDLFMLDTKNSWWWSFLSKFDLKRAIYVFDFCWFRIIEFAANMHIVSMNKLYL